MWCTLREGVREGVWCALRECKEGGMVYTYMEDVVAMDNHQLQ